MTRRAGWLFAFLQVFAIRLTDLRYLFPQLRDALFDRVRHEDRLAEASAALRCSQDSEIPVRRLSQNEGNGKVITITLGGKSQRYALT